MACTSFHAPTARWLTLLGKDAKPGDTPTLSVGHPITGGEFTTYRLGPVVAVNGYGEPLFDMAEAEVRHAGAFFSRASLNLIIERQFDYYGPQTMRPLRLKRDHRITEADYYAGLDADGEPLLDEDDCIALISEFKAYMDAVAEQCPSFSHNDVARAFARGVSVETCAWEINEDMEDGSARDLDAELDHDYSMNG